MGETPNAKPLRRAFLRSRRCAGVALPRTLVGCTGWSYDDWRGTFYAPQVQPGQMLERYARVFDVVEVDSSYYAPPPRERVERWAAVTPPGFTFTLKLPGRITHDAALRGTEGLLAHFLERIEPLQRSGKLGPLLVQLPASFVPDKDADALEAFLEKLPPEYRWAVELRNKKWWTRRTFSALERAGAALVWSVNHYASAPPEETADFLYARFIGDRELTRFDRIQRDLTAELRAWKERFEKAARASLAYIILNNHFMGHAPTSATIVQELLGQPVADLAQAARDGGQRGLADFS